MLLVSLILTSSYVAEHCYLKLECIGVQVMMPNLEAFVGSAEKAVAGHVISISSIVSNALELFFFVILIFELLKHQRMHAVLCPSSSNSNAAGIPARRNAVTALGHFFSWLIECIVFGTCLFIINSESGPLGHNTPRWIFVMLLPSINYAVFPWAQVFTSPELRNYVFGPPYLPTLSLPTVCYGLTCTSSEGGAGQGMEMMNVVQNGHAEML